MQLHKGRAMARSGMPTHEKNNNIIIKDIMCDPTLRSIDHSMQQSVIAVINPQHTCARGL